jgi:hypothetical protein
MCEQSHAVQQAKPSDYLIDCQTEQESSPVEKGFTSQF